MSKHCPECGGFLKEEIDHSPNLPDGGVTYEVCNNCGYEKPVRSC